MQNQHIHNIWSHKRLIINLVKREVAKKYKGSFLGVMWSLVTPMLMLAVYTFVFSFIFNARWGGSESGSRIEFSLLLFSGLMIFNLFAECVGRAPSLILENTTYVKKVVFPLEILPWVLLGSALVQFILSLAIWILAYYFFMGGIHFQILLLPIVLFPFVLFVIGLVLILSAIGVYVRDVNQIIGIIITMILFLSPIFYPASALPEQYHILFTLNPLTIPIETTRQIMHFGNVLNLKPLMLYTMFAVFFQFAGIAIFQKLRKGFSDVM